MNEKQKTCLDNCHTEEECIFCDKTHEEDIQNCPCGKNCQDGCPCKEFDCSILDDFAESCKEPNDNENYQRCAKVQKYEFDQCVDTCDGPTCSQKCATEYYLAIENCPCAKNCPYDCPCQYYDCESGTNPTSPVSTSTTSIASTTTTTASSTNTSILILYNDLYDNYD